MGCTVGFLILKHLSRFRFLFPKLQSFTETIMTILISHSDAPLHRKSYFGFLKIDIYPVGNLTGVAASIFI